MDILTNFDTLEYDNINNMVYDIETGEIIEDNVTIERAIEEYEKRDRYNKVKKKMLNKKLGKVDKRETHDLNWKERSFFIKIYRTEKREYLKNAKLSPNAGLFLLCIEPYIEFETNRIATPEGDSFTNKELEELTGLSVKVIKNTLDELERKKFIKRVGQRQARQIYFNPYLCCAGNEILKTTVEMFSDYTPITPY